MNLSSQVVERATRKVWNVSRSPVPWKLPGRAGIQRLSGEETYRSGNACDDEISKSGTKGTEKIASFMPFRVCFPGSIRCGMRGLARSRLNTIGSWVPIFEFSRWMLSVSVGDLSAV